MRASLVLAAALLAAGGAMLAVAAARGQLAVAWVLVVPVFVGTGPWGALGGLVFTAGVLAAFWAWAGRGLRGAPWVEHSYAVGGEVRTERWSPHDAAPEATRAGSPEEPGRPRAGGFLLLGPIPIAFGTTRGLAVAMLLLALLALALVLVLPRLLGGAA